MTSTLKNISKNVVTSGNYALATAGVPLFTVVGSGSKKRLVYNVLPGQLVAYTVTGGVSLTVDTGSLAASDINGLFIGVGVDTDGDGMTDDIRHIGIEGIAGCNPDEVSTSSPRCGNPQVMDFYFDCTECDETYSVLVKVDDNETRSFSPWNKSSAEFVGSVTTQCSSCDDCPVEHNCKEVACKLSDSLNGELDLKVANRLYPDWKGTGKSRPYFATRLHENSYTYCLSPTSADDCTECTDIAALTGVTINGTVYPFKANTRPGSPLLTMMGQIDGIVAQINEAFITEYSEGQVGVNPHAGSAYVTGTYQDCCPLQLHINTCDAGFILHGAAAPIDPTTTSNPFEDYGTVDNDMNCIDCGDTVTQKVFPCGIRVIAEQVKGGCDCYMDKPLAFYGRTIDILPYGEGWRGKPWRKAEVQKMELPAGFGSFIQWLEYQDLPEGRGRRYSRSNVNQGWGNMPESKSRIKNAVTAKCDTSYCSYYLKTISDKRKLNNERGEITVHSNIHIPSGDAATVAAWEGFFTRLISFNPTCTQLSVVNCSTDMGSCQ